MLQAVWWEQYSLAGASPNPAGVGLTSGSYEPIGAGLEVQPGTEPEGAVTPRAKAPWADPVEITDESPGHTAASFPFHDHSADLEITPLETELRGGFLQLQLQHPH